MRETQIVDFILTLATADHREKRLVKGIGDDSAILRPRSGEDLVFTTDFVLEGRHFDNESHKPPDIGHKALARSLSDLAAMGSEPVFCLVSLAVPDVRTDSWIRGFYRGLLALANKYRIKLAGGDLARFEKIAVDVMCCGRVPTGGALLRSGAKPGDLIYVTGQLGSSAHGFASRRGSAWKRHLRPEPRVEAGVAIRRLGASAAMDLSDGLSLDLLRLCRESRVGAELSGEVPVARGATIEEALHGGEDYELLFTASPRVRVPARVAELQVTKIGVITRGPAARVYLNGRQLDPAGFDHFG
jgi:thiamine-monophosphate kinase